MKNKIKRISDYGLVGITTTLTLTGMRIYPSNVFTTLIYQINLNLELMELNLVVVIFGQLMLHKIVIETLTTQLEI